MKKAALALLLVPALSGCTTGSSPSVSWNDSEIVGLLQAFHQVEIEQAAAAADRASSPEVRRFAATLTEHHAAGLGVTRELALANGLTLSSSDVSVQFEENAARTLEVLRTWRDAGFDRNYLEVQVQQHQWILDTIEDNLIPAAGNPALRDLLDTQRDSVSSHLAEATRLRGTL